MNYRYYADLTHRHSKHGGASTAPFGIIRNSALRILCRFRHNAHGRLERHGFCEWSGSCGADSHDRRDHPVARGGSHAKCGRGGCVSLASNHDYAERPGVEHGRRSVAAPGAAVAECGGGGIDDYAIGDGAELA
jgi:hypothetical protein